MSIKEIVKRTEKLITDNSSGILTGVGVAGVVTTAYLTGKASFKAAEVIRDAEEKAGAPYGSMELDLKERTLLVWRLYVPASLTGTLTIAAIIGSNRVGTRRAAALATAYTISEKAFVDYKEKVIEKLGENKEREVRDEIAQERITKNPPGEVIIIAGGDVLCYEAFSGRYFMSNMESIKKAMNDTNYIINNNFYASLSDFYKKLGLPTTSYSEEVGWNSDNIIDIDFSTVLSEDERPCISIDFRVVPVRDYFRVH